MNKAYIAIAASILASFIKKRPESGVWYPIRINSITPQIGSMNHTRRLYKAGNKYMDV